MKISKQISNNATAKGLITLKTFDSKTGKLKRVQSFPNIIVANTGHGINLIMRHLTGDDALSLAITQCKFGTGTTTPTINDTDLETPVVDSVPPANQSVSSTSGTLEFFLSDLNLPNGTYTEFGIFMGNRLWARALISPSYTKSSNEDTSIEYITVITPQ